MRSPTRARVKCGTRTHCAACWHPPPPCPLRPPAAQLLEIIARVVAGRGAQVMFYLAAAVADFFLPWSEMVRRQAGLCAATGGVRAHSEDVEGFWTAWRGLARER